MGMPMHRGLGPHLRGTTENVRGLGGFASPRAFGHGGVGTSYCWGDPESGVSFAYVTNNRIPDPWHSKRLDLVANLVHSALMEPHQSPTKTVSSSATEGPLIGGSKIPSCTSTSWPSSRQSRR
jgi:CubicO group peptidase (beta-lactamase class C family)